LARRGVGLVPLGGVFELFDLVLLLLVGEEDALLAGGEGGAGVGLEDGVYEVLGGLVVLEGGGGADGGGVGVPAREGDVGDALPELGELGQSGDGVDVVGVEGLVEGDLERLLVDVAVLALLVVEEEVAVDVEVVVGREEGDGASESAGGADELAEAGVVVARLAAVADEVELAEVLVVELEALDGVPGARLPEPQRIAHFHPRVVQHQLAVFNVVDHVAVLFITVFITR